MIALCIALALVSAPDDVLTRVPAGTSVEDARRALGSARGAVSWWKSTDSQALARGLVESKLLETLNRLALAPIAPASSGGGLDARAFRTLAVLESSGRKYTLAFGAGPGGKDVLRFALVRVPVPVDGSPHASDRLHRLKEAIAAFGLRPKDRDAWGNTTTWTGSGGLRAIYLPEDDELRVVEVDSR